MTKIEWTNETWNAIIGCNKISPGCDNCYAEIMAYRLMHMPFTDYYSYVLKDNKECHPDKFKYLPKWNGETHFEKSQLEKPLKWKKSRMIFTVSMGDLFHESVPFAWIDQIFDIIRKCPQHTFIILTKRPDRMKEYLNKWLIRFNNVWAGVTAENQEQAEKRIPILLQIPAKVHFVSVEPMLGPINLNVDSSVAQSMTDLDSKELAFPLDKIDWVICGGESGSKARPMHPDWARSLRDQCKDAEVPFFFKQWGEWFPWIPANGNPKNKDIQHVMKNGSKYYPGNFYSPLQSIIKIGKKKAGRLLDGKEHNEMPK